VTLPALSAAVEERRRESLAAMPIGEAMLRANRASWWPWLVGALVVIALVVIVFVVV